MLQRSLIGLAVAVIVFAPASTLGQDVLHERIDRHIEAKPEYAKQAAALADDAEFFRRIHLDLAGVIPSTAETRAFLKDAAPDKRAKLIDNLLAGPHYARHLANIVDVWLMDRRPDKHVKRPEWLQYLRTSFADNKPYDVLVREILAADGLDPKGRAPAKFFLDRDAEPNLLTRDVSRLFLGMNLQCAQCHDHPLVDAYKQDHYYGVYAFLNRSFVFTDKAKKLSVLAEKAEGDVAFESVFLPKVKKSTGPRLPDGPPITEPKFEKGKEYTVAPGKDIRPVPAFSRRGQLAAQITENKRFARAAANRLWFYMLGRGIVHPVDFDHEENPPSHPELLDLLATEFAKSKYDVKHLLRQIALSKTYQRSSLSRKKADEVEENAFAVANLRPLTPEQLAWSMMQATGLIDVERQAVKGNETALVAKLAGNEPTFVTLFGNQPGEPSDLGFQATLDQTLFLANGAVVRGWLAPRAANLTDRLAKLKNVDELADELYLSVLTRLPSAEERKDVADFLSRAADRNAALPDLAWALLASAEFRFNH
jgi:hypothetical protein